MLQGTKDLACVACVAGVDAMNEIYQTGVSISTIQAVATVLCSLALDRHLCAGMTSNYMVRCDIIFDG